MKNTAKTIAGPEARADLLLWALRVLLPCSLVFVFVSDVIRGADWEFLMTKHYWEAGTWYYGGYADQYVATEDGLRSFQREGQTNYSNIFSLKETAAPENRQNQVQGFPGTERLLSSFILYLALHLVGGGVGILTLFKCINVLLWLSCIYLGYKLSSYYFGDRYSPLLSAILLAFYPALTLTFLAIKMQPLGTAFLLAGICLYEFRFRAAPLRSLSVVLTALLFLGQFANGGWAFLCIYIFFRAFWLPSRDRTTSLIALFLAAFVAKIWLLALTYYYQLPSVTDSLHVNFFAKLSDSWKWLQAWSHGRDVTNLQFFGYPGKSLFLEFVPLVFYAFVRVHAVFLIIAFAGMFFSRPARILFLISIPLFFLGHFGTVVTGWMFHYGYLSFPAGAMLIIASAGVLAKLAAGRKIIPSALILALLAFVCWRFSDEKLQAGNYYGGFADRYQKRVFVHNGDESSIIQY